MKWGARYPLDCRRPAVLAADTKSGRSRTLGTFSSGKRACRRPALSRSRDGRAFARAMPAATTCSSSQDQTFGHVSRTINLDFRFKLQICFLGKRLDLIRWRRHAIGNVPLREVGQGELSTSMKVIITTSVTMAFALTRPARLQMHPLWCLRRFSPFSYSLSPLRRKSGHRTKTTTLPPGRLPAAARVRTLLAARPSLSLTNFCGGRTDVGEWTPMSPSFSVGD
jgi:hypothetical protein